MKIKKTSRRKEKLKKRLVPLTILGLVALGIIYQQIAIYCNASHLGRMGRLIDIEGVNMHLYESGTGDLPIVFTGNIGSNVPYVDLYPLHHPLSENHRVMVYDRPGYGWSDYTNKPRDIDQICREIHTLLHTDDVPGDEDTYLEPFIYVAQGMGALEAIRYAQLYPEDVAGIVFIEGTSPSFCADYNNIMIIESFMTNALRNTGLLRLMGNTQYVSNVLNNNPEFSEDLRKLNKGIGLEKTWNRNVIAEKLNVPNNAQVILDAIDAGQTLGDIPIRVITSQNNAYGNWSRTQKSLLSLSSDSSQTFIENSTTAINASDVPTILSTIEDLINHIYELRDDY
ncbi:MAG: alpha/beta hydrolase [Cellulosilyticum sp.]|nr:alpha/beta hydrolase [Cellulosilyticum sp.]MEE1071034.1 alpha/beta hydrolase [Cellulosilyticum sp.]